MRCGLVCNTDIVTTTYCVLLKKTNANSFFVDYMNISLRQLNRCDCYVIIWCLYQMQGLLYPQGIIGQALQALLIVWALVEAKEYFLPNRQNPPLLKATSILLFLYCIYGIHLLVFNLYGFASPHVYLQTFLASFLPFFLFYRYLKIGYLSEYRLRAYVFLFLAVVIWHYFKTEQEMLLVVRKNGGNFEEVTNNTGYEFLVLIPITFFFYRKPLLQYSLLCFFLLMIIMAMKRDPILIGVFCFAWALYLNIKAAQSKKHRYLSIILGLFVIVVGIAYIYYQMSNSDYMARRIEDTKEGNMSHRDVLYLGAIDLIFNDTSIVHLLIGRGAYATYSLLGNFAHQDWLETAVNNGFIGVVIVIYFCAVFCFVSFKEKESLPKQIHAAFQMMFFIFFLKTMFSMSLADMPCFQSMLISFCIYYKDETVS